MKSITGNTSNDLSFVACLLAKEYLCKTLEMAPFDISIRPQGAPGLDIDERTVSGERVIGEVKSTTPFKTDDLGAAQKYSFRKDFAKLRSSEADHKFFFVTDKRTFEVTRQRYLAELPSIEKLRSEGRIESLRA